jgi:hypothetical protein
MTKTKAPVTKTFLNDIASSPCFLRRFHGPCEAAAAGPAYSAGPRRHDHQHSGPFAIPNTFTII